METTVKAIMDNIGINQKLGIMSKMMRGVVDGKIIGLIVKGSPGIGKSYTLQTVIDDSSLDKTIVRHTGKITPVSLFHTLGDNKDYGSTIVLDDTDSAYTNEDSLNILKAASDTRKNRFVRWESSFKGMKYTNFEYRGGILILTNSDFDSVHYKALLDRFHFLDLTVTLDERIEQIIEISKSPILDRFSAESALNWILANVNSVDDVSMRTFIKVMDLVEIGPGWRELAQVTLCNSWKL